jgi:crotonobetainyl-CoA:carnitine CoA-transferase CaiB-like acyl-CoA transferase
MPSPRVGVEGVLVLEVHATGAVRAAGARLAQLGAEVIRVEDPYDEAHALEDRASWPDAGKRSFSLALESEDAGWVLDALMGCSNLVLCDPNSLMRRGDLGIRHEAVTNVAPIRRNDVSGVVPAFGEANAYVLEQILRLDDARIADLYRRGVVTDVPVGMGIVLTSGVRTVWQGELVRA